MTGLIKDDLRRQKANLDSCLRMVSVMCICVCATRFQRALYFCTSNGIHRLACSQVIAKRARPMASADHRKSGRCVLKQYAPSKVKK